MQFSSLFGIEIDFLLLCSGVSLEWSQKLQRFGKFGKLKKKYLKKIDSIKIKKKTETYCFSSFSHGIRTLQTNTIEGPSILKLISLKTLCNLLKFWHFLWNFCKKFGFESSIGYNFLYAQHNFFAGFEPLYSFSRNVP